ncbi:hypothetical protein M413DRAFT_443401 [Hebeloma cylindrosporum]|uniref:Uncharacterized protein n=1 Tax=Hebeloma cylindrosporum TaxID=76867 RepID=A0A0C3CIN2_HEBCY|nr:hypothetical protein M413DRAFT_443401 [Hebeloma cylindrosporum h7]
MAGSPRAPLDVGPGLRFALKARVDQEHVKTFFFVRYVYYIFSLPLAIAVPLLHIAQNLPLKTEFFSASTFCQEY